MYKSLLRRLEDQHQAILFIIEKLGYEDLTRQNVKGKWTIKDNIAHLTRYQVLFLERIHEILSKENIVFERYKAENDPEFDSWRQQPLSTLLAKLEQDRQIIVETITALTPTELLRTGTHKKYRLLTITEWTEFFILHEAHHIYTIFQLAHVAESSV